MIHSTNILTCVGAHIPDAIQQKLRIEVLLAIMVHEINSKTKYICNNVNFFSKKMTNFTIVVIISKV